MLNLSRDINIQCRHDTVRDVGTIKLRDQFSKHGASMLLRNVLDSQTKLSPLS